MSVRAIVVAAGSGTRLGAGMPKAFVELAGTSLLVRAVRALAAEPRVTRIAVVAPADRLAEADALLRSADLPAQVRVDVVAGGADRSDSVRAGLDALASATSATMAAQDAQDAPDAEIVLVHDAARCLVPVAVVSRVIDAVEAGAAAVIPVLPVVDTIKVVDADGRVVATPDRATLRAVQTPQGFDGAALRAAHEGADLASDDAALIERAGGTVTTVAGDERALKITGQADLRLALGYLEEDV